MKRKCKVCEKEFNAKRADVKRGWAKCCSKSCAAVLREIKNKSKFRRYRKHEGEDGFLPFSEENMLA